MMNTVLELVGLALVVAAVYVMFGVGPALLVAGVACLYTSWAIVQADR